MNDQEQIAKAVEDMVRLGAGVLMLTAEGFEHVRLPDVMFRQAPAAMGQQVAGWQCAARKQGTAGGNVPADCNWPVCGCDPYADKVIAALQEAGAMKERP